MRFIPMFMLFLPVLAFAQPSIHVVGLFKNKALVVINGKQKVLRVGQTFREVTLESANSKFAVLSYEDVSQTFTLGSAGRFSANKNRNASYTITPGFGGTYQSPGTINGTVVDFIVDTGASTVSLNSQLANQLGIDYKSGKEVRVLTAADKVPGFMVTLDKVTIGSIRLKNIEATVIEGEHPQIALLGMSFLKHVTVVNSSGRMKLIQE